MHGPRPRRTRGPAPRPRPRRRRNPRSWWPCCAELPEHHRVPVVLRHVVGLSYAEIASVLSCPVGTAKANVSRGLDRLRALACSSPSSPEPARPRTRNEGSPERRSPKGVPMTTTTPRRLPRRRRRCAAPAARRGSRGIRRRRAGPPRPAHAGPPRHGAEPGRRPVRGLQRRRHQRRACPPRCSTTTPRNSRRTTAPRPGARSSARHPSPRRPGRRRCATAGPRAFATTCRA